MEVEDLVTISDDDDNQPRRLNHALARLKQSKSTSSTTSSFTSSTSTSTATDSECTSATDDCIAVDSESSQKDENDNFAKLFEKRMQKQEIDLAVAKIKKKNESLAIFAETCLNLENNKGMLRIITRTLMKTYNQADKTYIESKNFQRVINKAINCVKSNPNKKFSYVKNLCDTLNYRKSEYYFTENDNTTILGKHKRTLNNNGRIKQYKTDSIVIDSDEDSDVIIEDVIDLDHVVIKEAQNSQKCPSTSISSHYDDEKENIATGEVLVESDGNLAKSHENLAVNNEIVAEIDRNWAQNLAINDENSVDMLLTPNYEEVVPLYPSQCKRPTEDLDSSKCSEELDDEKPQFSEEVKIKIEVIEKQILVQKMIIKQLDEKEVDLDIDHSPYIQCEKAKETIVKLYQELCELTGTPSVKKKKVRLQVLEGHPSGPTKKLEEFINNNIDNNGLPQFPDFCDVVKCVLQASAEDGLGWKKAQVLKEASSLFTQCGSALQKRRMQREYRDLITLVKAEQLGIDDDDPANNDPELLRKLEENRRIASRKENELLERYTMMQCHPAQPKPVPAPSLDSQHNGIVHPTTSSHVNFNHNNLRAIIQDSENNQCKAKPDNSVNHKRIQPILHVDEKINGAIRTENINHRIMPEKQINYYRNSLLPNPFAQVRVNINTDQNVEDSVRSSNRQPISTDTSKTVKLDLNNAIVMIDQTDSAGHSVEQNNTDLMNIDEPDSNDDGKSDLDSGNDSNSDDDDEQDIIKLVNTDDVTNHKSITAINGTSETKNILDTESSNTDLNTQTNNNNTSVNTTNISITANTSLTLNTTNTANESGINSDVNQSVVKVKKERVSIYDMLEALGDDFTSTVIEIEDPFLVIEILSDSEDEDNHTEDNNND